MGTQRSPGGSKDLDFVSTLYIAAVVALLVFSLVAAVTLLVTRRRGSRVAADEARSPK